MSNKKNPFAGKSFAELTHIARQMTDGVYDYTGVDFSTHFMDLTEVLMEYHDRQRDDLMRETIRGIVGRVQAFHGYGES